RQALRNVRKPLVVMRPKSLLRHKKAVSTLDDLASVQFQTVIDDDKVTDPAKVTHLILCGGKVFYDLDDQREAEQIDDVAIIRVEQLYPFPEEKLLEVIKRYPALATAVWCQEEPKNQGAWYCTLHHLR